MKKGIFLLIALLSLTNLTATNTKNNIGVNYRYNDAVTFIERGIEFHVFLNGNFDFNTLRGNDVYYNGNQRTHIRRDNFGRIRQIGNAVINYGFNGNVTAIGNVPIRYRFGQLSSVGNLFVEYDRWGYPHYRGFVKQNRFYNDGFNVNINLGTVCLYDDAYFYNRHFRNNYRQFREDANFFYYRAVPNAKLGNRNKILKRRKPNRNVVKSNNRYLKNNTRNRNNTITRDNVKPIRNNTNRDFNRNTTPNRKVTKNNRNNNTVRKVTTVKTTRNSSVNKNNNRTVNKRAVTKTVKRPVQKNIKRESSRRTR